MAFSPLSTVLLNHPQIAKSQLFRQGLLYSRFVIEISYDSFVQAQLQNLLSEKPDSWRHHPYFGEVIRLQFEKWRQRQSEPFLVSLISNCMSVFRLADVSCFHISGFTLIGVLLVQFAGVEYRSLSILKTRSGVRFCPQSLLAISANCNLERWFNSFLLIQ